MRKIITFVALALTLPKFASAHAFGQLYNLPVPFWMYLYGGAFAIVISFLFIGFFFNKKESFSSSSSREVHTLNSKFLGLVKGLSVFLFLLTIATGLIGKNSSFLNFNMTFFWIVFLLGLTYLTALIGSIYEFLNPWKIILTGIDQGIVKYPSWLGYYPALVFYFFLIRFELMGQPDPAKLSMALILYSFVNILGVVSFGQKDWFGFGELFSVFFRLIGKIAPIEYRQGKVYFRAPLTGLLHEPAEHFSLLLFILFMLSSTAFDGFRETLIWVRFYWSNISSVSYMTFQTLGLILSPFVFLGIYLILIWLAKLITHSTSSTKDLALQFAFTLIPIALVYNIAHYYTLIFTEVPNIVRLISDPFGFGWNLFHTAEYFKRIILGANFVWHSQVGFILLGHIVSVYLAHVVALKVFPSHKKALVSQIPMLMLMVLYTMIGLWILSQPLTGGTL